MAVTGGVVGLAGSAVVVGSVNLDDRGAAVAEHDEIGSAHAEVAELCPRQRQHGDRFLDRAVPLDFHEDLVDGKLSAAAEYQAVMGGVAPFCALAPCLVGGRLPVRLGRLVAPVCCNGGQWKRGLLDHQGLDVLAAVIVEHGAERRPDPVRHFGGELLREPGVYRQDGLVGVGVPVVSWYRVIDPAVPAHSQGGSQDEALGQDIAILPEQAVRLTENEVQLACVVLDLQADHASGSARGAARRVDGPTGYEPASPQFPAIRCQQAVQIGYQSRGLLGVWLDQWVGHLRQEGQQHLVGSVGELEPRIIENPVVVPVEVGHAVTGDVLRRRGVPGIGRRERVQIVELIEEAGLAQAPPPRSRPCPQEIEDVSAADRRDLTGLARCRSGASGQCHLNRMAPVTDTRIPNPSPRRGSGTGTLGWSAEHARRVVRQAYDVTERAGSDVVCSAGTTSIARTRHDRRQTRAS